MRANPPRPWFTFCLPSRVDRGSDTTSSATPNCLLTCWLDWNLLHSRDSHPAVESIADGFIDWISFLSQSSETRTVMCAYEYASQGKIVSRAFGGDDRLYFLDAVISSELFCGFSQFPVIVQLQLLQRLLRVHSSTPSRPS